MSEGTQTWDGPARGEEWQAPELPKSKDLVASAGDLAAQGKPAYEAYSKELILLAKQTLLPAGATDADLFFLFQLAGKYGLDPFAREIWLVPMRQKDERDNWITRAVPIIGRDGLLALAERNPYYDGHRAQVVREKDSYEVLDEPRELRNGKLSYVVHSYKGFGDRGPIVGAWCEVYLKARDTVLFEAPIGEYRPTGKKLEYSPWSKQEGVMIRKCAIVNAFREATRVSGVYYEEEFADTLERSFKRELEQSGLVAAPVEVPYPEDAWWAARLKSLFDAAEAARPGSYLPAKRATLLEAAAGEYEALERELVEAITRAGAEPPERIDDADWEPQDGPHADEPDAEAIDAAWAATGDGDQETLLPEQE